MNSSKETFTGGEKIEVVRTAGGHEATSSQQPAFPDFHRKLADPSGFAWLSLGASFALYAVVLIGARGIHLANASVPAAQALGSLLLILATIFEYLSGRTFPATMFGVYSGFFGGVAVTNISWFGLTGSFSGTTPNTYSPGGMGSTELADLQGLWISTFVIITPLLFLAATRQSFIVCAFLASLEVFFVLHMTDFFSGGHQPGSALSKVSGAFGLLSAILAWYMAAASLLTNESAFFTLPTFDAIKSE